MQFGWYREKHNAFRPVGGWKAFFYPQKIKIAVSQRKGNAKHMYKKVETGMDFLRPGIAGTGFWKQTTLPKIHGAAAGQAAV